jgi:hypothetical protein
MIEEMIKHEVMIVLIRIDELAEEMSIEHERMQNSPTVTEMTSGGGTVNDGIIREMSKLSFKIMLLKGLNK